MDRERVLPPHRCLEMKEAGYPQEGSQFVWAKGHGDWDLYERHEVPSPDNRISAMTKDEANKWTFENGFLTYDQCEDLCSEGYPKGKSLYLWHKDKHQRDRWVLYKRNRHDMSQDADKHGLNRWITAITHDEAEAFHQRKKAMIEASRPPKRDVDSLTFHAGPMETVRKSACLFATSCRNNLISITESWYYSDLKVTIYFWKED